MKERYNEIIRKHLKDKNKEICIVAKDACECKNLYACQYCIIGCFRNELVEKFSFVNPNLNRMMDEVECARHIL